MDRERKKERKDRSIHSATCTYLLDQRVDVERQQLHGLWRNQLDNQNHDFMIAANRIDTCPEWLSFATFCVNVVIMSATKLFMAARASGRLDASVRSTAETHESPRSNRNGAQDGPLHGIENAGGHTKLCKQACDGFCVCMCNHLDERGHDRECNSVHADPARAVAGRV